MAGFRTGLALGAGAAALAAGAASGSAWADPGAVAAPLSALSVEPATVQPGGRVDLRTFADCGGGTGTVVSEAFAGEAHLAPAADGGLFASASISRDAAPGGYRVVEVCGNAAVAMGTVTVHVPGAVAAGGGWLAEHGGAPAVPAPAPAAARPDPRPADRPADRAAARPAEAPGPGAVSLADALHSGGPAGTGAAALTALALALAAGAVVRGARRRYVFGPRTGALRTAGSRGGGGRVR